MARFTFHIKFSTSASTGFVEILGDPDGAGFRPLMARRSLQTLNQTTMGTAIPSHARIGIYRNAAISGTAHLWYLIKGSYDPYYRRGSPGKVLLRATLQRAFERGLDPVELLGTDDPYKRAWTPYSRQRQVLDAFAPSTVGSVEWRLENQGRRLARHAGLHRLRARLRPRRSLTGGGISSVPVSRALRWPGR